MTKTISILVLLTIALTQMGFAQQATTTTWKGTLIVQGTKLRLSLDVTSDGNNFAGEFRSIDQGNATFKVKDIVQNDKTLKFKIPQIGAEFEGDFNSDKSESKGIFEQSGMKIPLILEKKETKPAKVDFSNKDSFKLKEAWIGELDLGVMKPVMQFRVGTDGSRNQVAFFDSITEGRTDFEAEYEIKDGELRFDVDKIRLTFRGKLNENGDQATGMWSQGGRNVELTLTRKTTEHDKGSNVWDKRPQKPVGPFPYDSEEVKFDNKMDSLILAGTLTIPKGEGPFPAVVLISGSGAQDRDETLMEHKPFLVLADYLSRKGIAVLRYDDRGTGESTGEFTGATTRDFANDAAAGFDFLKTHKKIEPTKIGLAGHSEGGLVAPMVAGLRNDIAFVVLMAATGVPGAEISISQVEAMLRAEGTPEDSIEIEVATTTAVVNTTAQYGNSEDFPDRLNQALQKVVQMIPEENREADGKRIRESVKNQRTQLEGKWIQFFLNYDPRIALRKLKCPTLAIVGSKDKQVLPDLNMPEIKKALTEAGNEHFEMVIMDGLNHLFQTAETGGMSEYIQIQETFSPDAMKRIGDWITKTTNM